MKQFEIIDSFGDKVVVEPVLGLYTAYDFMGNKMPILGIELYSYDEDGFKEPYATLTVNFGEFIGAKDCAYIDTNNNSFTDQLLQMGFCQDTGFTKHSGFCVYPLWKFDRDFLKEIDVHNVYDIYEKKYDKYMNEGPELPVYDREGEIVADVTAALGLECTIDFDSNGMVVWANDNVYYGAEFYRYLLSEVCDYEEENGAVKGLELDLCHDFYDLCAHHGVDFKEYNLPKSNGKTEFVITISSGGGTVQDFTTCRTRKEAEQICENYGWGWVDDNQFEWNMDIEEREIALDDKIAAASVRSNETKIDVINKDEFEKE